MDLRILGQALVGGLLLGGVYALVAMGLTLIFGVMKIINFAHGTLMMLGMYASYWLFILYGVDPYLSILLSVPAFLLLGVAIQSLVVNFILNAPEHNQLMVTLGLSLFFQNLALALFKADYRTIRTAYSAATVNWGDIVVSMPKLVAFATAILLCALLFLLLMRTDIGKAMRAAAEEREGALLVGIDVRRIYAIAFGLGTACVGAAGAVVLPFFYVSPDVGDVFILTAFVVVVLGGMGNFVGALLGGLIIGVVEGFGGLLPGSLRLLVVFIIFVLVLLFKPSGLLGTKQ